MVDNVGRVRIAWFAWAATLLGVAVAHIGQPHHTARHYFDAAARLLVDDGAGTGLHLYGAHPEFQFGPPAVVVMVPFAQLDPDLAGPLLAVSLSLAGLGVLAGLLTVARRLAAEAAALPTAGAEEPKPAKATTRAAVPPGFAITGGVIVSGAVFLVTWGDLAFRTAHVDDVLAIGGLVVAVLLCTKDRPWAAAVVLGIAAAAKPWALGFVVIAAAPPGSMRWLRPLIAIGVAAACWAPFVLAEPETLDASQHGITVKPESVLALLGLGGGTTPGWCRPAQLLVGLALAAALVHRHRWAAAPLAVVTVRLALDPDVNRYYTVAFVAAALLFEWLVRHPQFPCIAVAGAVVLETSEMLPGPTTVAALTRLALLVVVAVVLWRSRVSPPLQSEAASRSPYSTASARRVETPSLA